MDEKKELIDIREEYIIKISNRLVVFLPVAFIALFIPIYFSTDLKFSITLFCLGVGMLGGFVSIQQRLRGLPIKDLQLYSKSWTCSFLFPFVGGILALVLYMLFLSRMIEGHAFPEFYIPKFHDPPIREDLHNFFQGTIPKSGVDFCKLAVWSFIAGFSERFVVNILTRFSDERLEEQKSESQFEPRTVPVSEEN